MRLQNEDMKKGALDALKTLLAAKDRAIKVIDEPGGDETTRLKMPKNSVRGGEQDDSAAQHVDADPTTRVAKINSRDTQADLQRMGAQKLTRDIEHDRIVRAQQRRNRPTAAHNVKKLGSFDDLLKDIKYAMASQVTTTRKQKDSYARVNPSYAESPLLMPGRHNSKQKNVPILDIYFDQSGSWGVNDIKKGEECIQALTDYEKRGLLKINRFYFANNVYPNARDARREGGTNAFPKILQNIAGTHATNVIIMSDGDLDRNLHWQVPDEIAPNYQLQIPGCVWWLWQGDESPNATKYLYGRRGNFQYTLN